jgi:NADH:ubiquinone oxidoreductase subunit 2 (subunit N)
MILLLLLLLYIVMVTLMDSNKRGIVLCRIAIIELIRLVVLHKHPFYSLALVDNEQMIDDQWYELLILIMGLVLIASKLGNKLSKNPIAILLVMANIGGAILLIYSQDWLVTLAAWELFNLALYLLAGAMGLHYFLLSIGGNKTGEAEQVMANGSSGQAEVISYGKWIKSRNGGKYRKW